jgi:hypothetical protein
MVFELNNNKYFLNLYSSPNFIVKPLSFYLCFHIKRLVPGTELNKYRVMNDWLHHK